MAGITRIRPERIWSPGSEIDDTLSPADHDTAAVSLLDTISYACSQLADILGSVNWYDVPALSIAVMAAKAWLDDRKGLRDQLKLQPVTIPAGQNWVVLSAVASETPSRPIAILSDTCGAVVAELGVGFFGSHSPDEVVGNSALNPENLVIVMDAATGDVIKSDDRQVYALLQVENGAIDGAYFDDVSNRGQLSFVRPNGTYDDLEACPAADVENRTIKYVYADREKLSLWTPQDWRQSTAMVDLAAPGVVQSLDIAYNGGSVIGVDTADVEWRLTDGRRYKVTDSSGATAILDIYAAGGGDGININAPAGVSIASGNLSMPSGKATIDSVEIGGASGRVASTVGNLDIWGVEDVTFTTVEETTPLPLDDSVAGPISGLYGGPYNSVSDAIRGSIFLHPFLITNEGGVIYTNEGELVISPEFL